MATWTSFDLFKKAQLDDLTTAIDWDGADINVALVTTDCSSVRTTADYFDDLTEVTPGGEYAQWGINLAAVDVTVASNAARVVDATTTVTWAPDAANPTDAEYAVLFHKGASAAASRLAAYLSLGGTTSLVDGLTISTASGIYFSW